MTNENPLFTTLFCNWLLIKLLELSSLPHATPAPGLIQISQGSYNSHSSGDKCPETLLTFICWPINTQKAASVISHSHLMVQEAFSPVLRSIGTVNVYNLHSWQYSCNIVWLHRKITQLIRDSNVEKRSVKRSFCNGLYRETSNRFPLVMAAADASVVIINRLQIKWIFIHM